MTTPGPAFDLSSLGGDDEDDTSEVRPKRKYYGDIGDDYLAPDRRAPYTQRPNGLLPSPAGATYGYKKPRFETANDEDFRLLQNLGPERLAEVQEALGVVGLIKRNATYRRGVIDTTTRKAFQQILGYANQNGFDDWREAFADYARGSTVKGDGTLVGPGGPGGGSEQVEQGDVVQLTDAVSLEQQVQQSAQQRLGRKLRKSEVERFVSVYNGIERKEAGSRFAAQDAAGMGADSTIMGIPGAGAASEQFIDNGFAQEEAGQSTLGYLDALKGLVG